MISLILGEDLGAVLDDESDNGSSLPFALNSPIAIIIPPPHRSKV